MIRNTTGWIHCVDRAVAATQDGRHSEHGGWSLAQDGRVYCSCGDALFTLEAVKALQAGQAAPGGAA